MDLPPELRALVPHESSPVIERWWDTLDEADRQTVARLWDERLEIYFFTPRADEAGQLDAWEQAPRVRGGRFVPHDDAWGLAEGGPEYFEYLLDHPELVLLWQPAIRVFHIGCTRHPAARACLTAGAVPVDFACPVESPACPLRPLRGARLARPRVKSGHPQTPRPGS